MPHSELLDMLASETDRRCETIIKGVEGLAESDSSDADQLESLRVEAHGLKGAALVVGQPRLAELARRIEMVFTEHHGTGTIPSDLAADVISAAKALHEGALAAAHDTDEPASVAQSLELLAG
jgi:chemotaxis protein histidine kinase CheA